MELMDSNHPVLRTESGRMCLQSQTQLQLQVQGTHRIGSLLGIAVYEPDFVVMAQGVEEVRLNKTVRGRRNQTHHS